MIDRPATQPAGWYHAQGDPPGTQRYWDGSQWVGGPQAAQGSIPAQATPAAGHVHAPTPAPAAFTPSTSTTPAGLGSRLVAVLIDALIATLITGAAIGIWVLLSLGGDTATLIGFIIFLVGSLVGSFIFPIWNHIIRQGRTGQTIGKSSRNIRLIADVTGEPVGGGSALLRALLGGLLGSICLLDYLWPLFDEQRKRLTDKILNFSVVDA